MQKKKGARRKSDWRKARPTCRPQAMKAARKPQLSLCTASSASMETCQWHLELKKAWRQYCVDVGEADRDPLEFKNAALMIATRNPKCTTTVFRSGHAALQCITKPPTPRQVCAFYARIVDEQTCSLAKLIQRAASEHAGGRARDIILLAGAYVYLLQRRMLAFFSRLRVQNPRWLRLRASFFENISRMFDSTTWTYIGHARLVCRTKAASWTNVFFWIVRVEYTCLPRPFCVRGQSLYSDLDRPEARFNTAAYNHQCGNWLALRGILQCLRPSAGKCGELLRDLVELPTSKAVDAALKLQTLLIGSDIHGMGHFNTKKVMWHCALLREAYDYVLGRSSRSLIAFRQRLFLNSSYGPGGLQGLRLLYPRVTQKTAHECAEDLRQYLKSSHGVTFVEAHDNQWGLCGFQKSVNPTYNRKPPAEALKDAGFFCDWHDRIRTYPGGPRLFKMICEGMHLGDEFDEFFVGAGLVAKRVQQGALKRDVSCRYCWVIAGAMTPLNRNYRHSYFAALGAVCDERRSHAVQCKKRRRL